MSLPGHRTNLLSELTVLSTARKTTNWQILWFKNGAQCLFCFRCQVTDPAVGFGPAKGVTGAHRRKAARAQRRRGVT